MLPTPKLSFVWSCFLALMYVCSNAPQPAQAQPPAAPTKENEQKESPAAEQDAQPDAQALLGQGDKLAEEKQYDDALLEYKRAYEQIVPMLRGLPFRAPVEPKLMSRTELQQYMQLELEKEFDPDQRKLLAATLSAFGFASKAIDVEKLLLNLYTEEVAGFYDPSNKKMFLIQEQPAAAKSKGLFEALFGSKPAFDTGQQKSTLAHEMTHALADQHFGLEALHKAAKHDDDMAMALSALIEGEAMVVMFSEMYRESGSAGQVLRMAPARMDLLFGVMKMVMPFSSGQTFRTSPRIFQESLIFPYHKGTVFLLHLTNRSGWKQVNRAFKNPPVSTEQILHPEKYFGKERDEPVVVELPELTASIPAWKSVGKNVLGEFQMSVLLERTAGGKRAAAGWDGDTYEIFERDGRHGLAWLSVWDDEAEAAEFAQVYGNFVRRVKLASAAPATPVTDAETVQARDEEITKKLVDGVKTAEGTVRQATVGERVLWIEQRGDRVAVVEGFDAKETETLAPILFQAGTQPKRFGRVAAEKKNEKANGQ